MLMWLTWQPSAARRNVRMVGDTGAAPVIMSLTRPPRLAWKHITTIFRFSKRMECFWILFELKSWKKKKKSQDAFTEHVTLTWTFLKMSLSHMLSFLTTPFFSSASFLLKAKSSSHLFSGVLAWPNTCGEVRVSQCILYEMLNKAADQRFGSGEVSE